MRIEKEITRRGLLGARDRVRSERYSEYELTSDFSRDVQ